MDSNKHKVVCFGEVLWDIFPLGRLGAFVATQKGACPEYELEEIKEPVQQTISKV
jgi:hypothetical protein